MKSSAANFTNEQLTDLLQAFFKNIVTKEDLQKFATREDITRLEKSFHQGSGSKMAGDQIDNEEARAVIENQDVMNRIREQILENQQAIDNLYRDMAGNKKAIIEMKNAVDGVKDEMTTLTNNVSSLTGSFTDFQNDLGNDRKQVTELMHNVAANTRVVGKLAAVVTDMNDKLDRLVTSEEIARMRNEMIQRLDGIVKRIEIFNHEQSSLNIGMKRMEKIQKEEMQRNDKQDLTIKKQQEKIELLERKISSIKG